MRVFFITKEWSALKRFVRRQVDEPEGMPSVYMPWLAFRQRGYEVHVFMVGDFDAPDSLDYHGCRIHLVRRGQVSRPERLLKEATDNLRLYQAAARFGAFRRPDLVYTQREDETYAAWALSRRFGAVCVKRIYGTALYSWWFIEKGLRRRLAALPGFLAWLWPSDLIVITNDGTDGEKLARFLGIRPARYRFWMNGINKQWGNGVRDVSSLRKQIGLADGEAMLLTLGRLANWKRHDRPIRALPLILKQIPGAKLVVAGDGPLRGSLETLARDLGVAEEVLFLGMVAHSRVRELMSAADVFILPYDLSCLGNTLLEAQICGAATVTWNVGGTREVVKDRVNGRLLSNMEPKSLAGAVVELLREPSKRRQIQEGARRFAANQLKSWPERMEMEISLIETLMR